MPKKFHFPVWLEGSKDQQEADAKVQEIRRASFGRGHLTDEERMVGRGALLEETARQNLAQSKGKDKEARILAENQLADALAMQGKFHEASEVHNDRHRRKFFRDVVTAIEKPDDEKCNCSDSEGNGVTITPRHEVAKVFSPVHGAVVSLIRCHKCNHLNARPARSRLLTQSAVMSQNRAMVEGNQKGIVTDAELSRGVLRDAQVLKR